MEHEDHGEIMLFLGKLDGKIDGINNHLETLNHRTEKSEDKIGKLEVKSAEWRASWKAVAGIAGVVTTFVYFLADKLLFK